MHIKIGSNFNLSHYCAEILEVSQGTTIRDLLLDIGKKLSFNFFDAESGNIYGDVQIAINGKDHLLIPRKLETLLEDGDSVEINLLPLGGG